MLIQFVIIKFIMASLVYHLCGNTREEIEVKTEAWQRVMEEIGLKINRKKTEYLSFNEANKKNISMQGYELQKVTSIWGQH
jgi:coenzyme F420-reducing hydrogenase delta subunit